ncbi:MAG TPA: hypothetical protein VLE51_00695 [Candidatus Saccharimonadales bacterium]|nr:hypothetical protein [Candidatus Saccharimonadales bacterium]
MQHGELELELTFLAKYLPKEIDGIEPTMLKDIYVPESAPHPNLRIRQNGNSFEITRKQPVSEGDASAQTEQTITLDKAEFDDLSKSSNKSVAKKRYQVKIDGRPAEVDVFQEKLTGLVLIDFEFGSAAEKTAFEAPDCCLADVTQEEFIAGGILSGKSYSDIKDELLRFNYKPLQ